MPAYLPHVLLNNQFLVTSGRSIFWENEKALILSDLHLGKTGHFRKSGIAIPQSVLVEDMQRLIAQIQFYKPEKLIIVGDLFHSSENKELAFFLKWRRDMGHIHIDLVKGNHDILKDAWYKDAAITIHKHLLKIGNFTFVHDINDCSEEDDTYCFSGHIHPGVKIRGVGRQALQLACFYFGKKHAVLPAFGRFTGTYPVQPLKGDVIFGLVDKGVVRIL